MCSILKEYYLLYKCAVTKLGTAATGKFINSGGGGTKREKERQKERQKEREKERQKERERESKT